MELQSMAYIATIVGVAIAAIVTSIKVIKFASPWIKRKLKNWWNKKYIKTEFTLGYKTELMTSKTHNPEYEIGYLFISYEIYYNRIFCHWWHLIFLDSLYRRIGNLFKNAGTIIEKSINNIIKFDKKKGKVVENADSYIYQNIKTLAFYPIKQFSQIPDWADNPYTENQTRIYFKRYESKKLNLFVLQNGTKWLEFEKIEMQNKYLFPSYININHNREPLMIHSKKIKKLLKKGFKKQFKKYKIGDTVCIRRRTEF